MIMHKVGHKGGLMKERKGRAILKDYVATGVCVYIYIYNICIYVYIYIICIICIWYICTQ